MRLFVYKLALCFAVVDTSCHSSMILKVLFGATTLNETWCQYYLVKGPVIQGERVALILAWVLRRRHVTNGPSLNRDTVLTEQTLPKY